MASTDFTNQKMSAAAYESTGIRSLSNRVTFTPVAAEVHSIFDLPAGARILGASAVVVTGSVGTGSGVTSTLGIAATPSAIDADGFIEAFSLLAANEGTVNRGFGAVLGTHNEVCHAATVVDATIALSSGTVSAVTVDYQITYQLV
jgi:hypothetical protein